MHYQKISEDVDWIKIGCIDPRGMDWDIDFLRSITRTIENNHHDELVKYNPRYRPLDATGSLISATLEYVLVNKKTEVGKDELINVFKYWNYLPLIYA